MTYDPISHDPRAFDARYPAALAPVRFASHGEYLLGGLFIAQGAGPHPTVLLLHGFPGNEKNYDLAQGLRRAGWNVMIFHYRGSWGSGGDFAFAHVLEDTQTALAYLRSSEAQEQHRVDASRIALAGHSMGGWAALLTAAGDDHLLGVASMAGHNMALGAEELAEDPVMLRMALPFFEESALFLHGTTGRALIDEIIAHAAEWNLPDHAAALARHPLLLIAGSRDEGTQPALHHHPLIKALRDAGAQRLTEVLLESDHSFNDRRIELARTLLGWLETLA